MAGPDGDLSAIADLSRRNHPGVALEDPHGGIRPDQSDSAEDQSSERSPVKWARRDAKSELESNARSNQEKGGSREISFVPPDLVGELHRRKR